MAETSFPLVKIIIMEELQKKIKEVSDNIARQLEQDIKLFGSSYLELGNFSMERIDSEHIVISQPVTHIMMEEKFELKKRTEKERVEYLIEKYFTGEITLLYLKIQLNAMPDESDMTSTST